ncbi:MAG: hypothetical protein V4654_14405 [Bdellovibrionota bacterium]
MKNFAKSSKGFVNLTFIFVLMSFVSLYLTGAFAIALSQQRDYVRSTCIHEATDIQMTTLKNVRGLFMLNPQSTSIRLQIKFTNAALVAAKASGQWELVPGLELRLGQLYQEQKFLDIAQKTLIHKASVQLQARHVALIGKINSGQSQTASPWRFMLTMSSYFTARFTPALAIRPDSEGGVGPNYEWQEQAEVKQNLAYVWNMFFETSEQYQRFFTWVNVLSLPCSVAPDVRGEKWLLTINGDK